VFSGCALLYVSAGFAQQPDATPGGAAGGDAVARQIEAASIALDQQRAELAALHQAKSTLDERMRWVERRARVNALGGEFSQTLLDYLHQLPPAQRFRALRAQHAEQMAAASDQELRVERTLHEIKARRVAGATPGLPLQSPAAAPGGESLDPGQRDALERLAGLLRERLETLERANSAAHELEQKSIAAQKALAGYLFWIPALPSAKTFIELTPSLAWTFSPVNWRLAGGLAADELARWPFWPVLALLTAGALLAARGRLRRRLVALSPEVVGWDRFRIWHALAAVAVTFALAVPGPMLLLTGAALLAAAPSDQGFVLSLSGALRMVAALSLGLSALAWLIDPDGLAIRYFGRSAISLDAAGRTLRRFMLPFVLVFSVAALNMVEHAPQANRESLGRLALGVVMLGSVVYLARQLRRRGPLVQSLVASAPHSWGVRLHLVWYGLLVATPLAGLFFAAAGYSIAAGFFWTRIVESLFLALGAAVLYGVVGLWVKVQRLHFAQASDAAQAMVVGGATVDDRRRPAPDVAALGDQARSLLQLLITLALVIGLWAVWQDAMPVLQWVGDYALWRGTETVGGKEVLHVLTIGDLFMAILVGVLTGVAVRKVGSLVDIVGMSQLGFQADATYAIKAVTRYSLAAAGVLVASSILGIGWGDVQWLVAALGVGLGFGLQEIVANFVSGLIVLAERPIRIGDVITVDKTTGKVARIRARATVVVDFDNKEVIIPNKTFITAPVVNWTLSSQVSRLVLKVGVPFGSNIAAIQQRIVEEVGLLPDVLSNPPPAVFFTAFADKNLEFEIHAYVGSLNDRFRVQHEINLAAERVLREQGADAPPS
jgi:potassium efflux system protein